MRACQGDGTIDEAIFFHSLVGTHEKQKHGRQPSVRSLTTAVLLIWPLC